MNDYALDRIDVDTAAGTYVIATYVDDDAYNMNPLTDWDHPGFSFAVFQNGRYETINTLSGPAGNAVATWLDHGYDNDEIERRFALWRAITGDRTVLVTSTDDTSQSDWYRSMVLVDFDAEYPDWDRETSARATIGEFVSWASGDVYGYAVTAPNGDNIASCWGFIGDDYFAEVLATEVRAMIDLDAEHRIERANMVGAGFVGIV